jgi:hypothetical protein
MKKKTPNAQRRTPNAELEKKVLRLVRRHIAAERAWNFDIITRLLKTPDEKQNRLMFASDKTFREMVRAIEALGNPRSRR